MFIVYFLFQVVSLLHFCLISLNKAEQHSITNYGLCFVCFCTLYLLGHFNIFEGRKDIRTVMTTVLLERCECLCDF